VHASHRCHPAAPAPPPRARSSSSSHSSPALQAHGLEDTTYLYDLGNTVRLYRSWAAALPRVTPFYAVKCNPDPGMLRLLAALGAGFDCASRAELEAVLALGVPRDRIIFAHPCKRPGDLRYAAAAGVGLTTFDTEGELSKVRRAEAEAQVF
jgi:ornithine decarboxylase